MNIEHAYYELTGEYQPFEGICLVDTFELAEAQADAALFTPENTERVERQKGRADLRDHRQPALQRQPGQRERQQQEPQVPGDRRPRGRDLRQRLRGHQPATPCPTCTSRPSAGPPTASETTRASSPLSPTTASSTSIAFDGMRKHLAQDFDAIYVLDLGGNVRKNPKLSGTTHNVFGIQVGVSINLLGQEQAQTRRDRRARSTTPRVDEYWRKEQKYDFLDAGGTMVGIDWQEIAPRRRSNLADGGLAGRLRHLLAAGHKGRQSRTRAQAIFQRIQPWRQDQPRRLGLQFRPRRTWQTTCERFIETYNDQVTRWNQRAGQQAELDEFVLNDDTQIKWSRQA